MLQWRKKDHFLCIWRHIARIISCHRTVGGLQLEMYITAYILLLMLQQYGKSPHSKALGLSLSATLWRTLGTHRLLRVEVKPLWIQFGFSPSLHEMCSSSFLPVVIILFVMLFPRYQPPFCNQKTDSYIDWKKMMTFIYLVIWRRLCAIILISTSTSSGLPFPVRVNTTTMRKRPNLLHFLFIRSVMLLLRIFHCSSCLHLTNHPCRLSYCLGSFDHICKSYTVCYFGLIPYTVVARHTPLFKYDVSFNAWNVRGKRRSFDFNGWYTYTIFETVGK